MHQVFTKSVNGYGKTKGTRTDPARVFRSGASLIYSSRARSESSTFLLRPAAAAPPLPGPPRSDQSNRALMSPQGCLDTEKAGGGVSTPGRLCPHELAPMRSTGLRIREDVVYCNRGRLTPDLLSRVGAGSRQLQAFGCRAPAKDGEHCERASRTRVRRPGLFFVERCSPTAEAYPEL